MGRAKLYKQLRREAGWKFIPLKDRKYAQDVGGVMRCTGVHAVYRELKKKVLRGS